MRIGGMRVDPVIDGECLSARSGLYGGIAPPTDADWARFPENLDPFSGHVLMTIGAFLIRVDDRVVLCDAGLGPKAVGAFATGGLRSSLLALGVGADDITDVVFSHLHVDHVGWTTMGDSPFFRNAELWIDRREWEHYTSPDYTMATWEQSLLPGSIGSIAAHFEPVTDRVRLFEPETEILPGIRTLDAAGHSPGNTVFELASDGCRGLLLGDLVHTVGELLHDWQLGFHHNAREAGAAIRRFRELLVLEELPFAAAHFPGMRWGRLAVDAQNVIVYRAL
jgi:glyoxylase-like metal-dependent hydrolase (beta-lactamase superfamily II)